MFWVGSPVSKNVLQVTLGYFLVGQTFVERVRGKGIELHSRARGGALGPGRGPKDPKAWGRAL